MAERPIRRAIFGHRLVCASPIRQNIFYRGKIAQAINQMDKAIAIDPERLEPGLIKFQYQLALDDIDGAQKTLMELKHRDTGERVDLSQAIRDFDNYLKTQ